MKHKKEHIITMSVFCTFLVAMLLFYIALPKSDFSELEKRNLQDFPAVSLESIADGKFGNDIETYLADHMPFRDFFVSLNSYFDLITGRQPSSDIYLTKDKALTEAPARLNEDSLGKNMKAINNFAVKAEIPVDFMIVPSAGYASRDRISGLSKEYLDREYIEKIYSATNGINTVNVTDIFDNPSLYYKTDHHWTSEGAYTAYEAYMKTIGKDYRSKNEFSVETVEGFYGSTYSRAALWLLPAESLELWTGSQNITVTNGESDTSHKGIFYRDRLLETDKYTVFLDGNHSTVKIHNPDAKTKDTILVVRDSYSNCLGGFLAESFETVILVDLRYYKKPVSELCTAENVTNILICYSLSNFLTDANIIWLR